MKEKYIQALILGTLIGGAIILDDFIKPNRDLRGSHVMMFNGDPEEMHKMHHPTKMQKKVWKSEDGKEINLDTMSSKKHVIMLQLDDVSDIKAELDKIEIEGLAEELEEIDIANLVKNIKDNIAENTEIKLEDAEIEIRVKIEKDSE
jgi:hypothetical protein